MSNKYWTNPLSPKPAGTWQPVQGIANKTCSCGATFKMGDPCFGPYEGGDTDYICKDCGAAKYPAQYAAWQAKMTKVKAVVGTNSLDPTAPKVVSFGFKYPGRADSLKAAGYHIIDVRKMKNPFHIEALRPLDGRDERVQQWLSACKAARSIIHNAERSLRYELMKDKGVAIGCHSGRHRSVAVAEIICKQVNAKGNYGTLTPFHHELKTVEQVQQLSLDAVAPVEVVTEAVNEPVCSICRQPGSHDHPCE